MIADLIQLFGFLGVMLFMSWLSTKRYTREKERMAQQQPQEEEEDELKELYKVLNMEVEEERKLQPPPPPPPRVTPIIKKEAPLIAPHYEFKSDFKESLTSLSVENDKVSYALTAPPGRLKTLIAALPSHKQLIILNELLGPPKGM